MDRAEPGVLDRLETAAPAGRSELRVRLLGMVVVRDHDRLVWSPCGPQSNRRLDGSAYPDDVVNLRVPIFARIRSIDPGRERARGEPAVQSQIIGFGGGDAGVRDGAVGDDFRVRDERSVGPDVHEGRGDHTTDVGSSADPRAVRARELPADSWVWGPERERASVHCSEREPQRVLSGRHARRDWARVLARGRV